GAGRLVHSLADGENGFEGGVELLNTEVFVIQDIDRAFAPGGVIDRDPPWLVELTQTRSRYALLADVRRSRFAYLENRASVASGEGAGLCRDRRRHGLSLKTRSWRGLQQRTVNGAAAARVVCCDRALKQRRFFQIPFGDFVGAGRFATRVRGDFGSSAVPAI